MNEEKYKFTMKAIEIKHIRSVSSDTLIVSIAATMNGADIAKTSFSLGDRGAGYYVLDQCTDKPHSIEFVVDPNLNQDVSIGYIVANVHDSNFDGLEKGAVALAASAASAAVSGAAVGSLGGPVGAVLGAATGILVNIVGGLFQSGNCDGVVAADTITYKASDIKNNTKSFKLCYPGTDSAWGCGSTNSYYCVESILQREILWMPQKSTGIVGGTKHAPALAVYKDKLYAAWRGCGDDGMWFSYYDGMSWAPQQRAVGDFGQSSAPALAVYKDKLFMAWRGVGDDAAIYYSEFDGASWKQPTRSRDAGTSHVPALAVYEGKLYMAWQGCGGDTKIWFSCFDGASWTPQQIAIGEHAGADVPTGEHGTSNAPTLAAYDGKLYMAWRSIGDDAAIYYSEFDGTSWKQPVRSRDAGTSNAPALAVYEDKLYMAWQGCDGDTRMWISFYDGTSWTPQQLAGEERGTSDSPALAEYHGKLYMVWKGVGNDMGLWFSTTCG